MRGNILCRRLWTLEERDRKLRDLRSTRNPHVKQEYKRLRNLCNERMKKDKREYEENVPGRLRARKQ